MDVLLLSTQLIDKNYIRKFLMSDNSGGKITNSSLKITVYESPSFYTINGISISDTKKKYFKDCLRKYVKQNKCKVIKDLSQLTQKVYHYFELMDFEIEEELVTISKKKNIQFIEHYNRMFLLDAEQRSYWMNNHKTYTFNVFYKYCRTTLGIFPNPIGGKWVYDEDNQKRLPDELYDELPEMDKISFPTDRKSSIKWLRQFINTRLDMFGPYQDVITDKNILLWHAGISPMLNMGMIIPHEAIIMIPREWPSSHISSYEGFLRQLFWREYMCMIYRTQFKVNNIFSSNVKLDKSWYIASGKTNSNIDIYTGIKLIDMKISQAIKQGYLHHIERLMLVGNIMLLMQIKPIDVYTWFMCNFVDAHHWVMDGNVYHMLLWASGRTITQRPYIASSTYLKRQANMSDEDCELYDKYYMDFILKNKKILKHTYMISGHLKRAAMLKKKL